MVHRGSAAWLRELGGNYGRMYWVALPVGRAGYIKVLTSLPDRFEFLGESLLLTPARVAQEVSITSNADRSVQCIPPKPLRYLESAVCLYVKQHCVAETLI